MKLRKIIFAVLLAVTALMFAACGDTEEEDDENLYKRTITPTPTATPTASAGQITPGENPTPTPEPEDPKYVIVFDPGHGGKDPGATYDGRTEAKLNLQLANMIRDYLTTNYDNVTVILTREENVELDPDKGTDLRARVGVGVTNHADIVVSLHLNASNSHNQHGSMVCISKQKNIHDQSEKLANCILNKLSELGLQNNGPFLRDSLDTFDDNGKPVDYYAICRHGASNNLISIIVESCYIDNDGDAVHLDSEAALREMAKAEAEGIMEFLTKYYAPGEG